MVDASSPKKKIVSDEKFKELEKFGRYQIWQYFWICLPLIVTSMSHVNYIFVAEDVAHRCKVPVCEDSNPSIKTPDWWPSGVDPKCNKPVLDKEKFNLNNKTCSTSTFLDVVEECHDWIYETNNSIVSQLNLGCQSWKATLVGSIHNAGMIFSMTFSGWISDKIGRKPTMIICTLGGSIGVIKVFLKNYYVYIVVEFLESVLSSGLYTVAIVLLTELGGDTKRVLAGVIFSYAIYMGEITYACLAMSLKYWKYILLVIYIPLLSFVSYFFILREGTRWQMLMGRIIEARKTYKIIVQTNKLTVTPQQIDDISDTDLRTHLNFETSKDRETWKDVFHSKTMLVRLGVASFGLFSSSFLYYGMLVHAVLLPGDKYVNFLLASVTSFPGDLIALYTVDKFGRKNTLQIAYSVTAVFLLATHFTPASMTWLKILLFLLGKLGIVVCFTGIYTYSLELFPTSVRGSLFGCGNTCARIGSMLAPLTILLKTDSTSSLMMALPNILFSVSAVIAASLLCFTPETKNFPLHDTIRQIKLSNQPNTDNVVDNRIVMTGVASNENYVTKL